MAESLRNIMEGPPDPFGKIAARLYPDAISRTAQQCVYLAPQLLSEMAKIVDSGVSKLPLQRPNGTLHITNNQRLIPTAAAGSSDGFCIVHFQASTGSQSRTFEMNIGQGIVTVARKPTADSKLGKIGLTSCLDHADMMPFLEDLIHQAALHLMIEQTAGRVDTALVV